MTVLEVIQRSAEFLGRKGIDSPRLQVELLLAHTLQMPRLKLYLDFERQLSDAELDQLRQCIKRRAAREPLQHIVGSTSFCGFEIKVSPDVLVPRPETEDLAERGWRFLQLRAPERAGAVTALDFGTGSGCLAVALARHVPTAEIYALDVSNAALEMARGNAARHEVASRIHFVQGDGLGALPPGVQFDLVLANPPYIPSAEIDQLAPEVRDHDPRLALDGGPDGLSFFRSLAAEAPARLLPGGRFMCEFGDDQGGLVQRIFVESRWQVEALVPDLSGRARILVAQRIES